MITYKYLLSITHIMMCNGFVFGVADYALSMW